MDYTMYDNSSHQIFQAESRHWQPSPAVEEDERAYMDACKAVLRAERVTGDKVTRATPMSAQVCGGNAMIVRASWSDTFADELAGFPTGEADDQVDAAADAFAVLAGGVQGGDGGIFGAVTPATRTLGGYATDDGDDE